MKKALTAFIFLILLMGTVSAPAFVKYDGIDGESKDANHDKWTDVLSVDFEMHQPTTGTGATRRRGDVILEDITITKEVDKATPKLMETLAKGKVIPKLELELTRNYESDNGTMAQEVYLRYELENVRLTSYSLHAQTPKDEELGIADGPTTGVIVEKSGEEIVVEKVSMNFENIKVIYSEREDSGVLIGLVEFLWDLVRGR